MPRTRAGRKSAIMDGHAWSKQKRGGVPRMWNPTGYCPLCGDTPCLNRSVSWLNVMFAVTTMTRRSVSPRATGR